MSAEEKKKQEHVTHPGHIAATKSAASRKRHELEKNTLADTLNRVVKALKEGPSRSTWIVIGIVVAAVGLYAVWHYFSTSSEEKNSARWLKAMSLFEGERLTTPPDEKTPPLTTEGEFEKFIKDHEGTVQARIARFYLARIALAQGERYLGSSRELALERVRKAADLYEKLQGESTDWTVLHQEAILRAGKAREMLGDFGKALGYYNQLVKEYPKSAFLDEAKAGQKRLEEGSDSRKELEELYARLGRKGG